MISECISDIVPNKLYSFEIENPDTGEGKWLTVDGIPIEKKAIVNNEVVAKKYSELTFNLNDKYANNKDFTLVDCGFYVWLDLKENESKTLTFTIEWGEGLFVSSDVTVSYSDEFKKGRGIVNLNGIDAEMKNIEYLKLKLDCKEMNNENCVEWTFSNLQISYNY